MATTFHPDQPVNTKPLHGGTVIYADDTCIRTLSAELLGGGGGAEVVAPVLILLGILFGILEKSLLPFFFIAGGGGLLLLLPIIFSRYKPNYLIFSRKSQEIYYVKSPKWIIRLKWKDIVGEYKKVTVFTGGGISQVDILRINGNSQYGKGNSIPASLPFAVADEEHATQLWAYFQAYMKHGTEGVEKPSEDKFNNSFILDIKAHTKLWLYELPRSLLTTAFTPKKFTQLLLSIFIIVVFPLLLFVLPLMWLGNIATAFVNSTRKRAPIPEDLLPYITDNPESYGKENSN